MKPWFKLPVASNCGWQNPKGTGASETNNSEHTNNTAIIGAGLAGLCTARALLVKGMDVTLYDAGAHCAAGASGSPAGIVKPYVTRSPSEVMRFYTQAHRRLFQWLPELDNQGGFIHSGALQLVNKNFPVSPELDQPLYEPLDAQASSQISGVTLRQNTIHFKQAGWLPVHALCEALLADVLRRGGKFITRHKLQSLAFNTQTRAWDLKFEFSQSAHKSVVLATGDALTRCRLLPTHLLPTPALTPARGQLTEFTRKFALHTVLSGNQYAIPTTQSSFWVGATFHRDNADASPTDADDTQNLASAKHLLANAARDIAKPINRFAGVRCTTLDRLPIVGPVPITKDAITIYRDIHHGRQLSQYPQPSFHMGLSVIGALGSRGIALAPYSAELLADWITGGQELAAQNHLISPLRFLIRHLKRSAPGKRQKVNHKAS